MVRNTGRESLSHYFYGIDYSPKDVKFGLIEAADKKIGGVVGPAASFIVITTTRRPENTVLRS
jgi:hypothetical protein